MNRSRQNRGVELRSEGIPAFNNNGGSPTSHQLEDKGWTSRAQLFFLLALGSVLEREAVLLAHSRDDGDHEVLAVVEGGVDLVTELTVGDTDVVLGVTVVGHEVKETVVDVDELVLLTLDVGDVHVVGRGRDVLKLLAGEDVDGDKVDLGVTVLAGLGGGHVDDL